MIAIIGDEQETSMMVERQGLRPVEQAISIAWFHDADREQLDASITIKSIVSHLPTQSLTATKRCSKLQTAKILLAHARHETRDTRHETRDTRHERETPSKQASNKQQEPIDEGTKNSTSLRPVRDHDPCLMLACPSNRCQREMLQTLDANMFVLIIERGYDWDCIHSAKRERSIVNHIIIPLQRERDT